MWCPVCGAEFRPGFTRCARCDADLVAQPPRRAPEAVESSGLRVVAGGATEEELAERAGTLERAGIPHILWSRRASGAYLPAEAADGGEVPPLIFRGVEDAWLLVVPGTYAADARLALLLESGRDEEGAPPPCGGGGEAGEACFEGPGDAEPWEAGEEGAGPEEEGEVEPPEAGYEKAPPIGPGGEAPAQIGAHRAGTALGLSAIVGFGTGLLVLGRGSGLVSLGCQLAPFLMEKKPFGWTLFAAGRLFEIVATLRAWSRARRAGPGSPPLGPS